MFTKNNLDQQKTIASPILQDAYDDFILSRKSMQCTNATIEFYRYTAGKFLLWTEQQGITSPEGVTARLVREYLAGLAANGRTDTTCHDHALRTLIRFWHAEGYIPEVVKFELPNGVPYRRLGRTNCHSLETTPKTRPVPAACEHAVLASLWCGDLGGCAIQTP